MRIRPIIIIILIASLAPFATAAASKKPNILFILSDDHRWDLFGFLGKDQVIQTPTLDGLAKKGVFFNNVHHASPICLPSRAVIMTGRYESETGVGFVSPRNMTLSRAEFDQSFPGVLRKNGYFTGFIGKYHFPVTEEKHDKMHKSIEYSKSKGDIPNAEYLGEIWAELYDVWHGIPGQPCPRRAD